MLEKRKGTGSKVIPSSLVNASFFMGVDVRQARFSMRHTLVL